MNLLQEYIEQQMAPSTSFESADLIELLSLESSVRADVASMGQALNVTQAIEALDIDKLSNEAYQVGIESILTTAGMDHIPTDLVVPSFESSQALVVSSGAQHEEKAAKKKGILKRIWDFIKGLWAKIKAKFLSIFKSRKAETAALMLQQHKIETAASAMGHTFAIGHDKAPVGPAVLGFHEAKKVSLGFLGNDPQHVAQGGHVLAEKIGKLTHALDDKFHKLMAIDYTRVPDTAALNALMSYTDRSEIPGTQTTIDMTIGRTGTHVIVAQRHSADFNAHPEAIPVKELVMARHAIVAAWDEQSKKLDTYNHQLDALDRVIKTYEQKAATATGDEIAKSEAAAAGMNRVLHMASGLMGSTVDHAARPALREIDKLLGVKAA